MLLNAGVIASSQIDSGATDLLNGLIAWWSMEESSGNRADSHTGGYTLTQNTTIGSTTGKVGDAVNFSGSTQGLSVTNAAFDLLSGDFHIALWMNPTNFSQFRSIINGVWGLNLSQRHWRVYLAQGSGVLTINLIKDDNTEIFLLGSSVSAGADCLVEVYHDISTKTIGISANNQSFSTTTYTGTLKTGSQLMNVGTSTSIASNQPFLGWIDEVAVYNRILTSSERAELYNSGNGLAYPGTP